MKVLNWISLTIAVLALVLGVFLYSSQSTIVYVRNGDVLQKFIGLKEANSIYEGEVAKNQGKVDTIIAEYQRKANEYDIAKNSFSKKDRDNREQAFAEEANRIKNFEQASKDEIDKKHEQLLTGVLNQINAFAEIYAKEKSYDIVIGTTSSGNLMFGAKKLDVTEDFIKRLNNYYKTGQ